MSFSGGTSIELLILTLLLTGYFAAEAYRIRRRLPSKRLGWWLTCRLLAIICLLLVLTGTGVVLTPRDTTTVFLVDVSLSVREQQSAIERYLNDQLNSKGPGDKVAVITFGREPMVEVPAGGEVREVKLAARPNPYFTDLERAVDFALDYFPEDTNRRLVLVSDGRENSGSAASLAEKIRNSNVSLLFFPVGGGQRQDVQLSSLDLPANIHPGERAPVTATLDSTLKARGVFRLFCEGEQVLQEEVDVEPGACNFQFEFLPGKQETLNVRGEIDFPGDANSGNNSLTASLALQDTPRVLVVGDEKDVTAVNSLLASLGIDYLHYPPGTAPDTMDFLSRFAEVFLVNVPHRELQPAFESNLAACVRELGTGLVVIGGERSFAPGGYENTLLEKMLPVRCRMKGSNKQPNLGLVLVVDCSGSMEDQSSGLKKIDMAREAALRSLEVLEPGDCLGVLAFADTLEWVVPFGPVQDKEKIKESVGRLSSRGGTLIIPALGEAVKALREAPAEVKHVILLTDGQGEREGYQPYAAAMKENKITLSAVAVGEDADRRVLEYLAGDTGGRSYFARDLRSVPSIFTRETYLAARKYINNEEFTPVRVRETGYFPPGPLPPLKGYVGTGIKDDAELILKSSLDDPVLATRRCGLGKVVAWTPDLNGRWSAPWLTWDGFQRQWSALIDWCLPDRSGDGLQVQLSRKGGEVEVVAAALSSKPGERVEMVVRGPADRQEEAVLQQVAPGKYRGKFSLEAVGDHVVAVRLKNKDEVTGSVIRTVHVDYSPEYALDARSGRECLQALAGLTGGRPVDVETKVFEQPVVKNRAVLAADVILLPLALGLFILDIAARRLDWFGR